MFKPTIENMPPEKIMRKRPFRRLLPSSSLTTLSSGLDDNPKTVEGKVFYEYPTYADFMREQQVTAHKIMSNDWYPDIIGWDETQKKYYKRKVARVTTNLPEVFASQRTSMLTGVILILQSNE